MDKYSIIVSQKEIHDNAVKHGWWDKPRDAPELLCLIHSEVSEALEAYRNDIQEGDKGCLSEELADIVIRVFDMAEDFNIDICEAVKQKHMINAQRPYRHGGKKA
jgi:NTP pyrophosphatase (non-canonical NTP hydrolase)